MTTQIQRRRGTDTQHGSFTGAEGELSVNTTNKSVHVHDGATAGGFEAARADLGNVSDADLNSALTGNTLSSLTITSADINGGTIDGTVIGGSTPAAGSFTTGQFGTSLNVDGTVTADGLELDGASSTFGSTSSTAYILKTGSGGSAPFNQAGALVYQPRISTTDGRSNHLFYTGDPLALRMNIQPTGDISFYEDTGTTPKLTWDASAQSLNVDGPITADGLTVDGDTTIGQASGADRTLSIGSVGALHFDIDTVGSTGRVYLNATNDSTSGKLHLQTVGADRLFINNNGDISFYEDTGTTPKFFWDASYESLDIGSGLSESIKNFGTNTKLGLAGSIILEPGSGNEVDIFNYRTTNLNLGTGGSTDMTIDASGRVGIGTSSPFYTLSVRQPTLGTIAEFRTIDGNNPGLDIRTSSSGTTLAQVYSSGAGANLLFETNGSERLRIDASGRVGIGTSSPSQKLDIVGDATSATIELKNTAGQGLNLTGGSSGVDIKTPNVLPITFGTSNTERMRIDSSGHAIIPAGVTLGTAAGVYNAANTLDDYEEGTWTATIGCTGNATTTTTKTGYYTKVGRKVTASFRNLDDIDTTGLSGFLNVSLPFACVTADVGFVGGVSFDNLVYPANVIELKSVVTNGGTAALFDLTGDNVALTFLGATVPTSGTTDIAYFTITYFTA